MEIYLNRLGGSELIIGFFSQAGWVLLLGLVYKLLWQKGLKIYSAYGG